MYECKILLDSISPCMGRLTTFQVTFPRIVLAEFNTHRMFSRNSASSRAIPVEKQLKKIQDDCFYPVHWGKNQKGMQAEQELDSFQISSAQHLWQTAKGAAVNVVQGLLEIGVHKQITNRLLEPFMWHTVIVTATEWRNFFALRDSKMAQPEIQIAANMMRKMYLRSIPQLLAAGQWHLPLVTGVDEETLRADGFNTVDLVHISAARCARVSYLTHDGKREPEADIAMYDGLRSNGHMSPLEHPARSLDKVQWEAISAQAMQRWTLDRIPPGNFWGWFQHRKDVDREWEFPREDLFWKEAA